MEKKKQVLVIEDEVSLRNAIRIKLESEGFKVLEAKNGVQGLEMALSNQPDLILLDIILPIMDGLTMLQKLRQDQRGRDVKVVILSNLNEIEKVSEAMAQGSYNYLVKSDWKLEDIVARAKEMLG